MIGGTKFLSKGCIGRVSCLASLLALMTALSPSRAFARFYRPYDYEPYPAYQPVPTWGPTGAALGPWHWNFNVGGGPTPALGGTGDNLRSGANFVMGGGYNFRPRLGLVLEFGRSDFRATDSNLRENQARDGDAVVESITLNPVWRYRISGPLGGYIIGGGGFYQRDARYSRPVQVFVPTSSGGFFVNRTEDFGRSDDASGVNIGTGITCNLGWGAKLFVEVRYHYIFTSGYATQILPVTIGIRW